MEGYNTEQEQIEELKKWWRKNGTSLLFGVIVALLAVGGTRYWLTQQDVRSAQASAVFESLMTSLEEGKNSEVLERGAAILSDFSGTPYATLAAFALAKAKQEEGDLTSAQTYLQWVLDNDKDAATLHVARLRLASVLWSQDQNAQALALLEAVEAGHYRAQYEELRGDILLDMGQPAQAREAYSIALSADGNIDKRTLEMKLMDLGGASE